MPEKRKDSKGRVLKDGESQRANGTYDYRVGIMNRSPQTPDFSRVWGPFLFAVALPWHYGIKSSSFLTASGTVEGYRWPYVRRVVWTSSWPRRSLTSRTGQPR